MCGLDSQYNGMCPWAAMKGGSSSSSYVSNQPSGQPSLDSTVGGPSPSSSYQSPIQQLNPQNYNSNSSTNSSYAVGSQGPQNSYAGGGQAEQTYAGQTNSVSSSYMPDGDKPGNTSISLAGFQSPQQTYAPKAEPISLAPPQPEPKPFRRPDDDDNDECEDPEHF